MAILLATHYEAYLDTSLWADTMRRELPDVDIRIWPSIGDPNEIQLFITDFAPEGLFPSLKNLKAVMYFGAGVDALLRDPSFPRHLPLVRSNDDAITFQVAQYVVAQILQHHRHNLVYLKQQRERTWNPVPTADTRKLSVALLGFGRIGKKTAAILRELEFKVRAWTRSPKSAVPEVVLGYGVDGLAAILEPADYVVCALPLTPETQCLINSETISKMKHGAYFINVGRGSHVVDDDVITALDRGQLSGASLDVFHEEPLSSDHPFWDHPGIIVTPHIANFWVDGGIQQAINVWRCLQDGQPLESQVNLTQGY